MCLPPQNTKVTEGGFDSHSFKQTRPRTRPKSRTASRISLGGNDDTVSITTCIIYNKMIIQFKKNYILKGKKKPNKI